MYGKRNYAKPLSHLFDKPILSPINLLYHFDNTGLSKITHVIEFGKPGLSPEGYFHIKRSGGLAPKFASEILVGATNFASKNIGDKYPKFCPQKYR